MNTKNLVVANWKMNPKTEREARDLLQSLKRTAAKLYKTEVLVAPSFVHLPLASKLLQRNRKVFLSAQNVSHKEGGVYTGEVSLAQLQDLKVKYVLVGHSERRAMGETNDVVNQKVRALLSQEVVPVLCVGEGERDIEGGYLQFIKQQISECLRDVPKKDLLNVVLAYEPVWAIGRSYRDSMNATDMHEMSLFIKKILGNLFGSDYTNIPLLYGGAVEAENTEELMQKGDINGLLVGHASLVPEEFRKILKAVDAVK